MCNLYLGADNSRNNTPPNPFWTNPSIISGIYDFSVSPTPYQIQVKLQNADVFANNCSAAAVDLYWSDPTTSFFIDANNQIPFPAPGLPSKPIDGQSTFPTLRDGFAMFDFSWTVTSAIASTNDGHVCLAAIASCTTGNCTAPAPTLPGQAAAVASPLVAIHNVHVTEPPVPFREFQPFFFWAANGSEFAGNTRLTARAYNPKEKADREQIWHLARLPSVRAAFGRNVKFAAPDEVRLAIGTETVFAPMRSTGGARRQGLTGRVAPDVADHLVKKNWTRVRNSGPAARDVELLPRQMHQAAVHIEAKSEEGYVYAVEVAHELLTKGKPTLIGGLTVLFAAPPRPW